MTANLFDYIKWRGDLDFSQEPLNPVDFLIFSQISYLPFDGIVPAPGEENAITLHFALENILKNKPELFFKEDPDFINALISAGRFGKCFLLGFVNQVDSAAEKQFSALCIHTGKNAPIIVYRGTDASFIGWKEDFNMSFREVIPSQQEAVKYINTMAPRLKGNIRICGHSKGGNLAEYAAAFCEKKIQKRITAVYSYDAPGFHETVINSDGFTKIKDKIYSYIPQGSVIGMMLERGSDFIVVKSSQIGLLQHLLFSWEVTHNDLVYAGDITLTSRFVDKTIREWINGLDNHQREQFIEGVYKILKSSEVKTVLEMEASWLSALGKIVKSMGTLDDSTRKLTLKTLSGLIQAAGSNLNTLFRKDST